MAAPLTLTSAEDASVNFITAHPDGEIEARYVRREQRYFICYVSSHTGCNKGCRFCHLTQTAQTKMTAVPFDGIVDQARTVLAHYDGQTPARTVHFNFMARGEAFASPAVLERGDELVAALGEQAASRNLQSVVKLSTIFPTELDGVRLGDLFQVHQPDLYYSLYSTNPEFRRRWLPRALPHTEALAALADWSDVTRKVPVIHGAFIAGENDSDSDLDGMCTAIADAGLRCDVNIVRYNPFSARQGTEPSEERLEAIVARLRAGLPGANVRIISRVGFDVAASCGMFVGGRNAAVALPARRMATAS